MHSDYLKTIVALGLAEDLGSGDITTNYLVSSKAIAQARFVFKSSGVVCGLEAAKTVFKTLSSKVIFQDLGYEGRSVKKNTVVAIVKGPARALLSGERVALNFLTHLSAVATRTKAFVDQVKPSKSKIYDTRKTTPMLRILERYAVKTGGGYNHRFDLSTMAMIKDNHRLLLGSKSLKEAVDMIKKSTQKQVILEVDTFAEFKEALGTRAEVILLDNMMPIQIRKAVLLRNQLKSKVLLEASGGIKLANVRAYAATGVDRISVGSLTSVIEAIDISLDFMS